MEKSSFEAKPDCFKEEAAEVTSDTGQPLLDSVGGTSIGDVLLHLRCKESLPWDGCQGAIPLAHLDHHPAGAGGLSQLSSRRINPPLPHPCPRTGPQGKECLEDIWPQVWVAVSSACSCTAPK